MWAWTASRKMGIHIPNHQLKTTAAFSEILVGHRRCGERIMDPATSTWHLIPAMKTQDFCVLQEEKGSHLPKWLDFRWANRHCISYEGRLSQVFSLRSDCAFPGLLLPVRDSLPSNASHSHFFLKPGNWVQFYYKAFIKKQMLSTLTQTGMTKKKIIGWQYFWQRLCLTILKNGYINAHFNNWHKIPLTG